MHRTHTMVASLLVCMTVLGLTQPGSAQDGAETRSCKGRLETRSVDRVDELATWTETELLEWFPRLPPGELGLFIDDSAGNDVIVGTPHNDLIVLGGGDNLVCAGAGHDVVVGLGEFERSVVLLGPGDDVLSWSHGVHRVHGGAGNDLIVAGGVTEVIRGGRGNDDIFFEGVGAVVRGGPGSDLIRVEGTNIRAYGGPGPDSVRSAWGSAVLRGGPGDDQLSGPEADDTFERTQLRGGGGDDHLVGDERHRFRGGPGTDTCVLTVPFNRADLEARSDATCELEPSPFLAEQPDFPLPQSWWRSG